MKKSKFIYLSLITIFLLFLSLIFVPVDVAASSGYPDDVDFNTYRFEFEETQGLIVIDFIYPSIIYEGYEIPVEIDLVSYPSNVGPVSIQFIKFFNQEFDVLVTKDQNQTVNLFVDPINSKDKIILTVLKYSYQGSLKTKNLTFDMPVTVISDDFEPVFEGETAFVTNVDDPMSIDDILSHIRLIDQEDGDVTESIEIVLDEYTPNMSLLGTYEIQIKGHDSKNNYAYLTIYVLVKDVSEPVISGQVSYNQSYTKKLNLSTILDGLSVVDNYDDDLEIVIESDNYSSNYNKLGNYNVIFSAIDSSGNKGTFTVNINVVDDVAPVFSGPSSIMKGQSEILTLDDIKAQLTAFDFIDGQVEITVKSDNYTGHGNKVGKYNIVFQAQDSSGNVGTHTVEITVSDNIPPIFYVDNYFITVEQSLTLTRDDIIAILQASGQLNIQSTTNIQFVLNEYEGNESVVGIYAVSVKASSADGSGQIFNLAVQVLEDEEGTVVHPDDPWYKQVGSWFVKAWDWLKEPVKEDSWIRWGYIVGLGVIVVVLAFVRTFKGKNNKYYRRW